MKSAKEFAYFCQFGKHYNIPFNARMLNDILSSKGIIGKKFVRRVDGSIDVIKY